MLLADQRFELGNRVRIVNTSDAYGHITGKTGIILKRHRILNQYTIEFDEASGVLHNGATSSDFEVLRPGKPRHCWNIGGETTLELLVEINQNNIDVEELALGCMEANDD